MARRKRPRAAAQTRPHIRQISDTKVGMRRESRAKLFAERQRPLVANHAVAGATAAIARR